MADTGETQAHEVKAHEQTWGGFKAMMTWGTVAAFAIGAFVVFLIAPK